jgi:gliding motility-associated-like protein
LNDHWGIDNVQILANDCGYYYDWSHIAGSPDSSFGGTVSPTTTTTYDVLYTNGINDTCYASVTVNVLFPDVVLTATVNPITICGGCTQLDATLTNIPPDSCCYTLDMDDSFGDGWNGGFLTVIPTTGPALGPFSATGSGSIVTFCVTDGTTFTLDYTSGAWETENTYTLLDPSMTPIFSDGPSPTTGGVFTTTASCGTAPSYTWTWSGPSLTAINDSTQTACPTVDSWYYVDVSASGCNTIDSVFIDVDVIPDSVTTNINLCSGSDYTFPDGTVQLGITGPVTQYSNLINISGCDSVVTTNVNIVPTINVTIDTMICDGSDYTFPDGTVQVGITSPVTQLSNFITGGGCDSIITTNITLYPTYNNIENVTICSGDNYTFPDGSVQVGIVAPVSYTSNLTTVDGCDSLITTNVSLNPTHNIVENVSVCDGNPYTYPDGTVQASVTSPTTYVSNLTTVNGCDSTITTNVGVDPVYSLVENVDVCDGSDYTFPDGFTEFGITAPLTHISNLTTGSGCDSIITTSVGVFPAYTSTSNFNVCSGEDFTFADGSTQTNITGPTTYVSTLTSVDGCDSLVTENVGVYPTYSSTVDVDQCPSLDYTFPDGTIQTNITNDVTQVSSLTTVNGCDSIITTNINVYNVPPMDITFSPNECPPANLSMTNNAAGTDCNWTVSGPGWYQTYTGCGTINDMYFNSGTYDVTLTMTSLDGCPMDTTIYGAFEMYPVPEASITWTPNEGTVLDNLIYFNNSTVGGDVFTWNFGDGGTSSGYHTTHEYSDTGHYEVSMIATNQWGCSDTAYGTIIINEEFFIFVPNAFTPDGDVHNNTFKPILTGHDPYRYTLYIFNRWGELIFESHNDQVGWDGTYNGGIVQDGVYPWKIEAVPMNTNDKRTYYGHVTLLK